MNVPTRVEVNHWWSVRSVLLRLPGGERQASYYRGMQRDLTS